MLGWRRYLGGHPDIELRFFFAGTGTTVANLLEFAGSGVDALVICGLLETTAVSFLNTVRRDIPIVICSHVELPAVDFANRQNLGIVQIDNEAIGRNVGEFFMNHGFVNFGFFGMRFQREQIAGRIRCAAFHATVMADDAGEKSFSEKYFGVNKSNGDFWAQPREEVESWIKSLSLPCGVFTNGDISAALFSDVCGYMGIDIPEQIEVVSVNNSYGLCEGMGTSISSIQPDFDACARCSIEMVCRMAEGEELGLKDRKVMVSSHVLVERGSSLSGRNYARIATRANEFIRKNACSGISVADVVRHVGVSRRTLEMRVKDATGNSVLEQIREVRMGNIRRLLEMTDLSISEIIARSGYNLTTNVGAYFKKAYGMTMLQYRASKRGRTKGRVIPNAPRVDGNP